MERLTEKIEEHYIPRQERLNGKIVGNRMCLDKLGEYENLEEQGLLLKLPCRIGDTVYIIPTPYIMLTSCFDAEAYNVKYAKADVRDFTHFISCGFCVVVTSKTFGKLTIPFSEFGKTIFLTKEEVEQKLKNTTHH